MGLFSRLFKRGQSEVSLRPTPGEEDPRDIRGSTIWGNPSPLAQEGSEPPPEYIAEATEPTEEEWAREQELYREKNEGESEPPSGS